MKAIEFEGDRPVRLRTDQGLKPLDQLVIAAGAWSGDLAYQLRYPVPTESERGYHVTVADPGIATRIQAMSMRHAFVAMPMEMGMRFAGTVELAGLDAPPNPARARSCSNKENAWCRASRPPRRRPGWATGQGCLTPFR